MKTSLIACLAGVNNSGERERGQHVRAPRVPEIPLPLPPSPPSILRPTTQAISLSQSSEISVFIDNQYKF